MVEKSLGTLVRLESMQDLSSSYIEDPDTCSVSVVICNIPACYKYASTIP